MSLYRYEKFEFANSVGIVPESLFPWRYLWFLLIIMSQREKRQIKITDLLVVVFQVRLGWFLKVDYPGDYYVDNNLSKGLFFFKKKKCYIAYNRGRSPS